MNRSPKNKRLIPLQKIGLAGGVGLTIGLVTFGLLNSWFPTFSLLAAILASILCVGTAAGCYLLASKPQRLKTNRHIILALLCCAVFFGLGAATLLQSTELSKDKGLSITFDEVSLLPNGYYYQENGTYFLNPEHPPLVKDISAAFFDRLDLRLPKDQPREILLQDFVQYLWGKEFLFEYNDKTEEIIFFARASVLFVNTVLLFILFISLAKAWSKRAALIALALLTMSQFSIAHAVLSTVDFMAAILTMLTLVWFAVWLKSSISAKNHKLAFGFTALFLGFALLAKFSTILLLPVLALVGLGYLALNWKSLNRRRFAYLSSLAGILLTSLIIVTVWYAWHVRDMSSDDVIAQLQTSYATDRLPSWGKGVIEGVAKQGVFGRAFAEYTHGLLMVNNRIYKGAYGVYFMGQNFGKEGAGLSYFPILYLAKFHIVYHLLSLLALGGTFLVLARTRLKKILATVGRQPLIVALVAYSFIFAAISITSTLQLGLRHIFPVVFGLAILTAIGLDYSLNNLPASKLKLVKPAVWGGLVIMLASVFMSFPNYLSYYNFLAGGTDSGYKLAADSNYDWGQDLKHLVAWQEANHVDNLYVDLYHNPFLPMSYYFGKQAKIYKIDKDPLPPSGSYLAVSVHNYQVNKASRSPASKKYQQFDDHIVARLGKTIFVYRIP